MPEKIIQEAKELCEKFINKVETGRARSRETYADCIELLKIINANELSYASDKEGKPAFTKQPMEDFKYPTEIKKDCRERFVRIKAANKRRLK